MRDPGGWRDPMTPLTSLPVAVVDLETTGLRAFDGDAVIEVGLVPVDGLQVREDRAITTLVDPRRPVSDSARDVHGIPDAALEGQPTFEEVLPTLLDGLSDRAIVGHNVGFDIGFLRVEMRRLGGRPAPRTVLDTVMLARCVFGHRGRGYGLDELVGLADVPTGDQQRHRALGDAVLTARVYVTLVRRLLDQGAEVLFDLHRLCAKVTRASARGASLREGLLDAVLECLRSRGELTITYASPRAGSGKGGASAVVTLRKVTPVALRGLWLDAQCHLRGELRTFRLDRIQEFSAG